MALETQEVRIEETAEIILFPAISAEEMASESGACDEHYQRALEKARTLLGMAPVREHLQDVGRLMEILKEQVACGCGTAVLADTAVLA